MRLRRPSSTLRLARLVVLVAIAAACAPRGAPRLAYDGTENCDYCRMTLTDPRFGAALVTTKGKPYRFDAIECLAGYVRGAAPGTVRAAWVSDVHHPGTLVPVDSARFVQATTLHSPMGRSLVAVRAGDGDDAALRREFGGDGMSWTQVLTLVAAEPVHP